MAKAELKTKATEVSVASYIAAPPDERKREEAAVIDAIYRRVTGLEPKMWGPSIIGYGSYTYKYESGHGGTMCKGGFSPRKAAHTLYLMGLYFADQQVVAAQFALLGKYSRGKGCLYVKRLEHVDLAALETLVKLSWDGIGARVAG